MESRRRAFCALFLLIASAARAEQLGFRRAVDLALSHSGTMAMAAAEQVRAQQGYLEARNTFIPQLVVGSGLGYSYGYPMSIEGSAPSVFNMNAQSFLLNAAQRSFVKAAKIDWMATSINMQDKRNQVILETALAWTELDKVLAQLRIVREQAQDAAHQQDITAQRVGAGIESNVELTRARLASARVRMRTAELSSAAAVLRSRLSQLTGLPAAEIETDPESLPALPAPPEDRDSLTRALDDNANVRLAAEQARAKEERARGEHKQWYPSFDFAMSYGVFARFNNYDEFFQRFQRNNATIGVGIRFPFLNLSQRARAAGADAEALVARKQAEAVKQQVSTETLKLQGAVRQLAAAHDVARLEYDLAHADTQATTVKVQAGEAGLREQDTARINEAGRYEYMLDVAFELQKAQLQLLRQLGQLEGWALSK